MKKKMKVSFRILGKIGFLLVVLGFLMPIACGQNGFELAQTMNDMDGTVSAILLYVMFVAALAGCGVGVMLLMKKKIKVYIDWVCLLACIGSGLILYLPKIEDKIDLQSGAYIILIGWIIALAAQVISKVNKEA